jgi:son of sevenless
MSPRGSPKSSTHPNLARNPQGREIPLPPRQGSPQQAQQTPSSQPAFAPASQDPSRVLNWSASRGSIRRPLLSSVGLEDVNDPRVEKFEAADTEDVIRFSDDGTRVIGGTIEKLIQRLTYDGFPDPQFVQSFMMTYRTFLTPRELMTMMELRWNSRPPADKDLEQFCKERMLPIRLRVFHFLKTWIEKSFSEIQGDEVLVEAMREFVKRLERAGMIQPASQLLNALERRLEGASSMIGTAFPGQQPPPPFPHAGLRFRDFHPVEVARQLTIAENALFRQVQPHELLDVSWTKKDKETKSPNVLAMIRFSNQVISWISSEIVMPEELRERGVVLNRFIAVAQAALALNNYNAAMEVVSALHNASVYRLQQTWNMLPDETWTAVEALERLFESDDNFKNYRIALERSVPPCVPYLGRYLSDLLFIEEKHQRMLDDTLINFGKLDTIASTIGSLELQQKSPYALQEVPDIINYIKNYSIMNERDLYNISLQREARKAK